MKDNAIIRYFIRMGSPKYFYHQSEFWMKLFGVIGSICLLVGLVWGLFFAPPDFRQGDSYRIIFIHVPSAIISQSCYFFMGMGSIIYLIWRVNIIPLLIQGSLVFGMVMTAVAVLTGAIWGKPTWGTWWEWDARIVSMLFLFVIYLGLYFLFYFSVKKVQMYKISALFCVLGLINLPIIKYSVEWWLTLHQPPSFTLLSGFSMPKEMYLPLVISLLGFYGFFVFYAIYATRLLILQNSEGQKWAIDALEERYGISKSKQTIGFNKL